MKKLILCLISLVGVSIIWAGGQQGETRTETVTLNYWTWHPAADVIQPVIEKFELENPGIEVNLNVMESTVYQERLPLALASGEELDVVGVQTGLMPSQLKGYLEPLENYFSGIAGSNWASVYNPLDLSISKEQTGTDDMLFVTAGRYGSAIGLYNAKIFNELNLEVPQTYEELKEVVKVIKSQKPEIMPVVFTGDSWFLDEMVLTIVAQQSDLFNEIRYDNGGRWDDPRYVEALKDFKKLFDEGVFENMSDISYGRAAELFDTGEAAIFFQGTWEAPRLSSLFREKNGIGLENVGAMALPVMRDGGKPALRAFSELGFAIPKDSNKKDAAAAFVYYMTGGEGFNMLNESTFLVPNKVDSALPVEYFETEEGSNGWELVVSLVSNATSHRNNMSAFSDVTGRFIQMVLDGSYDSVEKACSDLQAEFESGRY